VQDQFTHLLSLLKIAVQVIPRCQVKIIISTVFTGVTIGLSTMPIYVSSWVVVRVPNPGSFFFNVAYSNPHPFRFRPLKINKNILGLLG